MRGEGSRQLSLSGLPSGLYRVDLSHFSSLVGFPFECAECKEDLVEAIRNRHDGVSRGLFFPWITKLTFAAWRLYWIHLMSEERIID